MRSRITPTLAALALVCTLFACGGSKLDRVIAAVEGAPLLVDTFNLQPEARTRVNGGFSSAASCLRAYRDGRRAEALQVCVSDVLASGAFTVEDERAKARIGAILFLVRTIVGVPARSMAGKQGARVATDARTVEMTERQVRELERLLKP